MSHSSLSAQLASLHSKNTTSSRLQDDSIGRGIHHSANAGHSILNNNTKHKPSVLHADSRAAAAADVPFTTLRENAVVSLQYLSEHCSTLFELSGENLPWQTLFGSKSIKHERGLNTPETNAKFDGMIKEALYLLSSAWGDATSTIAVSSNTNVQIGSSIPSSVLHALEYLVQKYYVHVFNAEHLLVAFLPHHETFLFDRLLQLIDLAQMPHWAFLRPYSAAVGMNGVPRTSIAKWAASTKDNGGGITLVKRVCELAKRGAKIHALERNSALPGEHYEVRRGASLFMSFAAAILAETLHLQYSAIGSINEATLRCLVPFVLGAVEPNNSKNKKWSLGALCSEWRAFGHILISLLVDKCDLSTELCEAFSTGIVKGAIESIHLIQSENSDVNHADDTEMESSSSMQAVLDVSADAILAMFSLVVNNRAREEDKEDDGIQRFLPLIKSKGSKTIGCNLSYTSYRALMKLPFLSSTLGYLLEVKNIDIEYLVGSIVAMSISIGNSAKGLGRDHEYIMAVLSEMFEELSLKQIWAGTEASLATSTAAFIVDQAAGSRGNSLTFEQLGKLLAAIKTLNSAGCDAGVAFSVTKASSIVDSTEKDANGSNIKDLLNIAGLLDKDDANGMLRKSSKNKSKNIADENFDLMLPPSVALEHPSKALRLDAIAKLVKSAKTEEEADDTATALVRRYMSDDDSTVASASADGIVTMSRNESLSGIFFLQTSVAKDITFGLQKWLKSEDSDVTRSALQLSGTVAKIMKENLDMINGDIDNEKDAMYDCFESIIHGIVMALGRLGDSSALTNAASEALHRALHQGTLAKSKAILMKKSMKSAIFQKIIQRCVTTLSDGRGEDLHRKEQLVWFFLRQVEQIEGKECDDELSELIVDASLLVLQKYKKKMKMTETFTLDAAVISSNLDKCASHLFSSGNVGEVTRLVSDLCVIQSNVAYEEVCLNVLKSASKSDSGLYPHILMEVISRQNLSSEGVERILSAIELIIPMISAKEKSSVLRCLLVCTTALFCHSDLSVRENALNFFTTIENSMNPNDTCAKGYNCISSLVSLSHAPMRSHIMMDGSNALPKLLSSSARSQKDGAILRETLLETCAEIVTKHLLFDNDEVAGEGICHAVVVLMEAMEAAGEESFALSSRWRLAGKPIFEHFLDFPSSKCPSPAMQSLVDCVIVMLKGVTVENADDGVVISTGPAISGRRRRSYSVGNANGIAHIDPYPIEMVNSITSFLTSASEKREDKFMRRLCRSMNQLVLGRSSWCNGIFPKLQESVQYSIIKTLLILRSDSSMESAGLALLGLPLTTRHFVEALSSQSSRASKCDAGGLLALTALLDCIRAQAGRISVDQSVIALSSLLYEKLSLLSSDNVGDGSDYARTCVIHALLALTTDNDPKLRKDGANKLAKNISLHSSLLVTLLGEGDKDIKPLVSSRSKALCLQLLTNLCALSPTSVIDSLIPALISSISFDGGNTNVSKDAMMAIVPAYCKHASSEGFSLLNLLSAFLQKCNEVDPMPWETKIQLFSHLNEALLHCSGEENKGTVVATVVTIFIANEAFRSKAKSMDNNENSLFFLEELLSHADADDQIAGSLKILQYIGSLVPQLQTKNDHLMDEDPPFFALGAADICNLILKGPQTETTSSSTPSSKEKIPVFWSAVTLLSAVKQTYATNLVKKVIRNGNDEQASVCLNIWQELMVLQSNTARIRFEEAHSSTKSNAAINRYWESMADEVGEILSNLQNLLPVPHFLASVSSLIQDIDVEVDIQRRAILLLAERSVEIDNTSHEAILFLEMLPDLVNLAGAKISKGDNNESCRRASILSQSSFKAIDQLSKNLGLSIADEKLLRKRSQSFLPALQAVADSLNRLSAQFTYPKESQGEEDISTFNLESQVLSSAILCAASLITLLNAKCLSYLPKIVKPLINLLTSANTFQNNNKDKNVHDTISQSLMLIQLSTLRALVAVAEHIPQFFIPFVGSLLTPHGLPSSMMRCGESDEEIAVANMADRLDRAIAVGSPVRQLIPILSKSTSKCLQISADGDEIWQESLVIFKLMKLSIEKATRADLGPLAGKIINSLTQAYSFECGISTTCELIDVANSTLLAMVMKLSEAQLRPLYAKLREWRGDIDTSDDSDGLALRRRSAFWSLSAAMGKELRSIFLPCMSTVVGDISKQLEVAASSLCSISKLSRGHKRQKVDEPVSSQSASTLQPLLLCLETALKADAHEGGTWIRGDDGQRYTQILVPLAKLLGASVPDDCDILPMLVNDSKTVTAYERLIQGVTTEDYGNVVNCLTSLAAAAGNEQLWKPLNHALLEACGHERRVEVRRSGVKALLSIIHALGEEYMVLLPECLPVLSELLEDEDEGIVALAKECVQQGEELLGESLEDSLR